jgi:DNA polymerase alpha subunit B
MVPNTPATGKLNKSSNQKKRPYETPSMSRVKAEIPSSSPDYKSPMKLEDQLNSMNALP